MAGNRSTEGSGGRSRRGAVRRRGRPTGRWFVRLLGLTVVLVVLGGALWLWRSGLSVPEVAERIGIPTVTRSPGQTVTLYFADSRWTRLAPEERTVRPGGGAVAVIEALVAALAEGPREGGARVLPAGSRLRSVYLGAGGLAVVDFEAESLAGFSPGGASGELLTVFSVVHTLVENVDGITSVQILVGGETKETLAGHVKISEPLGKSEDLVDRD